MMAVFVKLKTTIKTIPQVLLILFFALHIANCRGGACAAENSPGFDLDADCIDDGADNCPFEPNTTQRDSDLNGIGDACEGDEPVVSTGGLILPSDSLELDIAYPKPEQNDGVLFKKELDLSEDSECVVHFLVGCHGEMIGLIGDNEFDSLSILNSEGQFGDENSPYSLYNKYGAFGSEEGVCSAFNKKAALPPALYCLDSSDQFQLQGYITTNDDIQNQLDPCESLQKLNRDMPLCHAKDSWTYYLPF